MLIQVDPASLDGAGSELQTSVSARLLEVAAVSSGLDAAIAGAAGDPGVAAAADRFAAALTQALSNGGFIAGAFGRALNGGAAAYTATDARALPPVDACPAPQAR